MLADEEPSLYAAIHAVGLIKGPRMKAYLIIDVVTSYGDATPAQAPRLYLPPL